MNSVYHHFLSPPWHHISSRFITAMAPSVVRKLMLIGRDRSTDAVDAKRLAVGSARASSVARLDAASSSRPAIPGAVFGP